MWTPLPLLLMVSSFETYNQGCRACISVKSYTYRKQQTQSGQGWGTEGGVEVPQDMGREGIMVIL